VRAQIIGWSGRSPATPPRTAQGPWPGRFLGMLLLVLALAALYHGTAGQAVWRDLTAYLSGGGAAVWTGTSHGGAKSPSDKASVLAAVPESEILAASAGDVAAVGGLVDRGAWHQANVTLNRLNQEWLRLSGLLAADQLPAVDINNFTAILTDAQTQVQDHAAVAARADVDRLQSEFDILALDFVGTQSPTFVELRDLSTDMTTGVHQRDWKRVSSDVQSLATIVQQVEQGY